MSITPTQRIEWRELAANATPGPWRVVPYDVGGIILPREYSTRINGPDGPVIEQLGCNCCADGLIVSHADARFTTEARTAVPALLDEVDRLTRERDEARARAESAEAAIHRIQTLHRHATSPVVGDYCADCDIEWPCPTIYELDKEDA